MTQKFSPEHLTNRNKRLYENVHSTFIQNSFKLKTIQRFINTRMFIKIRNSVRVYLGNRIIIYRIERDKSHRHHVEQKKPDRKIIS